jgi:hypothetical protein
MNTHFLGMAVMPKTNYLTSENVVSLRTAVFRDDGYVGTLHLSPRYQGDTSKVAWVFSRRLPLPKRIKRALINRDLAIVESQLRPDEIPQKPQVDFIWSDNGLNVAVLIDKNPMAFIHENAQKGYSKCIKHIIAGNLWDEELYRRTFT